LLASVTNLVLLRQKGKHKNLKNKYRMQPAILALFIPILLVVGLFTTIALRIYFKYKAQVTVAEHSEGESLDAWIKAEALARVSVARSTALRTGGFLVGTGIGAVLGIFIGGAGQIWAFFNSLWDFDYTSCDVLGAQLAVYLFFIMACAMLMGGVGMVVAYFVDRALEGRKQ
jgi:hypothetical protein